MTEIEPIANCSSSLPSLSPHTPTDAGDQSANDRNASSCTTSTANHNNATPDLEKGSSPDRKLARPKRLWAQVTLVGGWFLCIALAFSHHFLLYAIHGQPVNRGPPTRFGSQFQIKLGSYLIARLAVFCLEVVTGAVLNQMVWSVLSKNFFSLATINHILTLPDIFSAIPLISPRLIIRVFPVILLVACDRALELVTAFAPNALNVVDGLSHTASESVDSLDLSLGPIISASGWHTGQMPPTFAWMKILIRSMMAPTSILFRRPTECTEKCSYSIKYKAPAAKCSIIPDSELTIPFHLEDLSSILLYNATNTLQDRTLPYTLRVEWREIDVTAQDAITGTTLSAHSDGRFGVQCPFYDATYYITVHFDTTGQRISTDKVDVDLDAPLIGDLAKYNPSTCHSTPDSQTPGCWIEGMNYRETVEGFSKLVSGRITNFVYDGNPTVQGDTPGLMPLFNMTSTRSNTLPAMTWSFRPNVDDVATSMEDIFANITYGLISARNNTVIADVTTIGGQSVWAYDHVLLAGCYGPALLVFGVWVMYGLQSVRQHGVLDNAPSTIMAATGADFANVLAHSKSFEDLKKVSFQFKEGKNRFEWVTRRRNPT